jgi:hypothetical protein
VIIDAHGSLVKKISIANPSTIIYVDKVSAGNYFIRFIQEGRIIQIEQFCKTIILL